MFHTSWRRIIAVLSIPVLAVFLLGMGYSDAAIHATTTASSPATSSVVGLPGYHISLFAAGTSTLTSPDSVVADGKYVYVGYQNDTLPDGSNHKASTIVAYDWNGEAKITYSIVGHCDGLRIDPWTHQIWATVNEDADAVLYIIDPHSGSITSYPFPPNPPHGGGYDDLAFINGMAFVAASNPTLNSAGVNTAPALDMISIQSGKIVLTPVLYGNAQALDTTTNKVVTLNEIDPDSLSLDPQGDVVLDNQGGAELVFLHNAGTKQQAVTRIPLGTQVDDTAWATSTEGSLLIVDSKQNAIYRVRADFVSGTVYTEAPADSGVAGFVGTLDLSTGTLTPVIIGLDSPTGLIFVPDTGD